MSRESYETTTAPRRRRADGPARFTLLDRAELCESCSPPAGHPQEGDGSQVSSARTCRHCGEPAPILHPDPDGSDGRRVICGSCQGAANLRRSGAGAAPEGAQRRAGYGGGQ